jgi:lysophospholipase L1-like esterase
LALGDSILCGPEEGAFGVPPRSWAQWLAEALDLPFHKLAQPGARTPWIADALLPRARDDYALACVGVGTNDVRALDWNPTAFATALERILDGLAARAARICVATVPLDLGRPRAGAKVAALNALVRSAAATRNAVVIDLDDLRGWRLFFPDAVHPTALGQLEIARRAAAALALDVSPIALTSVQRGLRADARYAGTRQVAHLLRDWRRRTVERNV